MCKQRGFYQTPDCEGHCEAGLCEAVTFDPQGHIVASDATRSRKDLTCFRCRNQTFIPPPECHGSMTDPACNGMCPAKDCEIVDTIEWQGNHWYCYDCKDKSACETKGFTEDPHCGGKCDAGSICIPVSVAPDGHIRGSMETRVRGEDLNCYACLHVNTIEITWVIIIIETPYVRVVLDNNFLPMSMLNFTPQSLMALATPNNPAIQNLERIAQLSGGKVSAYQAKDLAGMLSESLKKKRKFSDDCFSDFKPAENQSVPPQSSQGDGKKNDKSSAGEPPSAPAFGEDPKQDLKIDGPVIACGGKDKEDAVTVYDANGVPAQTVTKQELTKNPGALLDALVKAENSYETFLSLKNMTPAGLAQAAVGKVTSMLTDKILSPRKPRNPKEKIPPANDKVEPNDPLYWPDYGKKESQVNQRVNKAADTFASGGWQYMANDDPLRVEKEKKSKITDQWGIRAIGFTPFSDPNSAWNTIDRNLLTQPNTLVALIDSGFDMSHPDGPQYVWNNAGEVPDNGIDDDNNGYVDDVHGWNFLADNADLRDFKGHGTFVAGIIAAKINNGQGIAGLNPGAVIMPLKVANTQGEANNLNIFRAINYAVNEGAQVINISLGSRGVSEMERSAIHRAWEQGVFVAVASGNMGENISNHGPASSPGAFAVGSMDYEGTKSTISNWGANNGLIAPGDQIYSLRSADSYDPRKVSKDAEFYYKQSGTSFSTPMVAAVASLLLAKNPNLTNKEIEDILHATARDLYDPGWDSESGAGLLNAAAALRAVPDGLLTVKLTRLHVNHDKRGQVESVDVSAVVRGPFDHYLVELGKGKRADHFKPVSGSFTLPAENNWLVRINESDLHGSNDWVVRLRVTDKSGKEKTAEATLILKKDDLHDY